MLVELFIVMSSPRTFELSLLSLSTHRRLYLESGVMSVVVQLWLEIKYNSDMNVTSPRRCLVLLCHIFQLDVSHALISLLLEHGRIILEVKRYK
jgi:hypothetical protein